MSKIVYLMLLFSAVCVEYANTDTPGLTSTARPYDKDCDLECKTDPNKYDCDTREYLHNSACGCFTCKKSCAIWIANSEKECDNLCPGWELSCWIVTTTAAPTTAPPTTAPPTPTPTSGGYTVVPTSSSTPTPEPGTGPGAIAAITVVSMIVALVVVAIVVALVKPRLYNRCRQTVCNMLCRERDDTPHSVEVQEGATAAINIPQWRGHLCDCIPCIGRPPTQLTSDEVLPLSVPPVG